VNGGNAKPIHDEPANALLGGKVFSLAMVDDFLYAGGSFQQVMMLDCVDV